MRPVRAVDRGADHALVLDLGADVLGDHLVGLQDDPLVVDRVHDAGSG